MIKAVIFDLDGTLLDSIDAFWQAFNQGVFTFQLEPISRERLMEFMNRGDRLAKIMRETYPDFPAEEGSPMLNSIMAEIRKRYPNEENGGKVDLMTGALELLNVLKQRGLKVAVVTSRTMLPEKLALELRRVNIAHYFDVLVTSADARRKPAPDTIIKCVESLKVPPEECLMVGDSQADVMAGKAAGVRTVAVATGVSPRPALAADSPDFVFDNLLSFIAEIDSILGRY